MNAQLLNETSKAKETFTVTISFTPSQQKKKYIKVLNEVLGNIKGKIIFF